MDLYSVSAGNSVGNELSKNARDQNEFRIQQNAVLTGNIANTLQNDKTNKKDDTEFKVGMDSYGGAETIGSLAQISQKGGVSGLASQTADNFRSAGNKISNLGATPEPPPRVPAVGETVDLSAPPVLKPSDVGITTADDVSEGLAEGLTSATGEGAKFEGVADAGGVSRFLLNRVGGVTSELGLEVGGKALGGVGGAISAGQDISNMIDTGHIFKPGESKWSEAGNIASMVGAGLDMMSIAVPILAPLAVGANVFSAVAGTIGAEQDDNNKISTDSKPPQQETLSIHPAWNSIGMTASVHQPQIA
jgi:hypothetical protein